MPRSYDYKKALKGYFMIRLRYLKGILLRFLAGSLHEDDPLDMLHVWHEACINAKFVTKHGPRASHLSSGVKI